MLSVSPQGTAPQRPWCPEFGDVAHQTQGVVPQTQGGAGGGCHKSGGRRSAPPGRVFGASLLNSLWRRWPGCAPVLLLKPPAAPQDRLASLSSSAHLARSLWPFRCFWCPKQRCVVMGCTRGPLPASFWSLAGAGLTKSHPKASPPAFSRENSRAVCTSSAFCPPAALLSLPCSIPGVPGVSREPGGGR